ncbi:polyphosphate kinase 2 [Pseudonocardia sediminis]|uniref:ADP/GDP-polyphosphate phosphotransferase n=1 Tax=Pseudonocardia sediminis TaxID=1397368 RepID=A0A4Q7UVI1_PSEST|nr:polyphosphate kinase 2 [Pseudonocardia sediminis]RZT85785.1 polyphosphate kinase 2 [Pseudonocardia sediminis]
MTSVEQAVNAFRRTPQGAGHSERTRDELREALRSADLLDGLHNWSVVDVDDDEGLLVDRDGVEVGTWREDYPYAERMAREEYEAVKRALQIELLKMQSWVKDTGQRVVVLFEGRDAAGKGGTIQRFTQHLNPRGARVVALDKPDDRERTQWYFQRYFCQLPSAGEIVLFDRSWYNRAVVERVMGFCTDAEYAEFMSQVPSLENALVDNGIHLIKLWFSVSRPEQRTRFTIRVIDPLRQWKLSPVDLAALDRWDDYTAAKEAMFAGTDTAAAPWTVVKSNDKKRGRIAALRWVLSTLDYPTKDVDVVGTPDPLIAGPPSRVYESSERGPSAGGDDTR